MFASASAIAFFLNQFPTAILFDSVDISNLLNRLDAQYVCSMIDQSIRKFLPSHNM